MTNDGKHDARPGTGATEGYGRWAEPVLALALLAVWIALALVLNGEPEIDRRVSAFFFSPAPCPAASQAIVCGRFAAAVSPFWQPIRNLFHYLPALAAVVVAASLARDLAAGRGLADQRLRFEGTALLAYLLGPGLVVNVLLKEHWGRPRPVSTDLFGGELPFVPAGQWSDACPSNCSFVSGEAASVFWLVCLIPLFPRWLRARAAAAILAIAFFTSGLRVAFGGHYLSDVALGGLSTLVIFAALATVAEWGYARARQR